MALPLKETVCGEPLASSVRLSMAVLVPTRHGRKGHREIASCGGREGRAASYGHIEFARVGTGDPNAQNMQRIAAGIRKRNRLWSARQARAFR